MGFELLSFSSDLVVQQGAADILACNAASEPFGLTLTATQAHELAQTRVAALKGTGRIEFGGGTVGRLIRAFCDSPYLAAVDYADTLHTLTELFYYYKNETGDRVSDGALIGYMKTAFDGVCRGSLELLADRELPRLAKELRGIPAEPEPEPEDNDGES